MGDSLPPIRIKLFRPGQEVIYNGKPHIVNFTRISRKGLLVYLEGVAGPISEDFIDVDLTTIDFKTAQQKKQKD